VSANHSVYYYGEVTVVICDFSGKSVSIARDEFFEREILTMSQKTTSAKYLRN